MKKRLIKIISVCLMIACIYAFGSQNVLALAMERISVWTTSLRYDLEVKEPVLNEDEDGNGVFTADTVCSENVVGREIQVAVVFYDAEGKMIDYWVNSHILEKQGGVVVSGTVPDYAKVGIYFLESETLEPIQPSVMSMFEGQTDEGNADELIAALEKRMEDQEKSLSELSEKVAKLEEILNNQGYSYTEQKEFFNSGRITGTEGIGTIDMNGFGFIVLKEWLTETVSGVKVNLYLNGKTIPVTCEVLNSNKEVIRNITVTDVIESDGEHIFDISFSAEDIEEDFCYLAIYNTDRENGYWLGFSTIDTSSEWYQKTSSSGIPPIYLYGTQKNWIKPSSYPKRYFSLLYDEIVAVEKEDVVTKEYVNKLLSEYSIDPGYDMIQAADEYIAVEGDTLEIFYRSILDAKNPLNYNIHAYCSIGTSFEEKFVVPSTVPAGIYPLTLTIKNDKGELIDQKTININVQKKAESPSKTVNVLCMGASTVSDGVWVNEFYRRLTQTTSIAVTGAEGPVGDGLSNINFIGKRTTNFGAGYEGFGGWSWGNYISTASSSGSYWVKVSSHSKTESDQESIYRDANGILWQLETIEPTQLKLKKYSDSSGTMPASGSLTYVSGGVDTSDIVFKSIEPEKGNPFCYNGKLDFKAYCKDIGASGIDYVYAQLIYNDTPNRTEVSQEDLERKAEQIRTFLIALLEDYPDAKLVLMNSPVPSFDGCGTNYTANSVFQNWQYMKDWLYKHQSVIYPMLKAEFPDNIYFCDYNAQFDIEHGYPTTTVAYNTRTSQTYQRQSNGVHPTNEGKMQCADATYRHFTFMLNESAERTEEDDDGSCGSDHTYEAIITAPTCTEQGYTTYTCECGYNYVDDYVDAAGHIYKNGICSVCGEWEYSIADLNLDGSVNVFDAYTARLIAAKLIKPTEKQLLTGDVDLDGRITAIDANIIRKFAAKIITSLPVAQ